MDITTISNGDTIVLEDGRKVFVIDYLNPKELIVKEIFIVNGKEIPQGEKFTIEVPDFSNGVISWREKNIRELECKIYNLENEYKSKESKLQQEYKELKLAHKKQFESLRKAFEYNGKLLKTLNPDIFNTIINFLTGEIKWVIINGFSIKILDWNDFSQEISYQDNYDIKLKLLTLYGRDSGHMDFGMSRYSDGSGTEYSSVYFCNTEEEVKKRISEILSERNLRDDDIPILDIWNIEVSESKLETYKNSKLKILEKIVNDSKINYDNSLSQLKNFKLKFNII